MGSDLFGMRDETFYYGMYRALVVSTSDPLKAGRIQARVFPMFYSVPDADLPWVVPASPLFSGAGTDSGSFMVPDMGSYVFVFFEAGRITQPVYFAEAQTATLGIPLESATNYPHRKVLKTGSGILVYIDDITGEISVKQPSGAFVTLTSTGKIQLGNQSGELISILSQFLQDWITAYVIGTGGNVTFSPAMATQLVTIKAQIDSLKE